MNKAHGLFWLFALSSISPASAHTMISTSGGTRIPLMEIYSSESCSSCPPADKWATSLRENKDLWRKFVPVVFHVDYWNDLGWVDGLSSNSMTKRQQNIAQTWAKPSVYTPAVVVNGQEWKAWGRNAIPEPGSTKAPKISIFAEKDGKYLVEVESLELLGAGEKFIVRLAKLGVGLISKITSGENSGKELEHSFVVLGWDAKPVSAKANKVYFKFDNDNKKLARQAIAAWIERIDNPIPLQATGGYL